MTQNVPQKLDIRRMVGIPGVASAGFRLQFARQEGNDKKLLLRAWGGIGDEICAEPAMRFALDNFKGFESISLAAHHPELFRHLKFDSVQKMTTDPFIDHEKYWVFDMIAVAGIPWDYICHVYVHCVDAPFLYAFRGMAPNDYRQIQLHPDKEAKEVAARIVIDDLGTTRFVIVHAGKHWQSKTFPKKWWDSILELLRHNDLKPVLVGGTIEPTMKGEMVKTTIDLDTEGCLDLRGQLSIMESIALIQESRVVLTNDSAILHMAAASTAWIVFGSYAKHIDYLLPYRNGKMGYKTKVFGKKGLALWEKSHFLTGLDIKIARPQEIIEWLPEPEEVVQQCLDCFAAPW